MPVTRGWMALCCVLVGCVAAGAVDWPGLLGPQMTGAVDTNSITLEFPERKPHALWSTQAGFGSAPAVAAANKVFVFGLFKPGVSGDDLVRESSAPTLTDISDGDYPSSGLPGTPKTVRADEYPRAFRGALYAQCFHADSGKRAWATKLTDHGLAFKTNKHAGTGWEVASPLVTDGRLFIHTHTGHLYCLDANDGRLIWDCNLFEHRMSTWFGGQQGNSSAPVKSGNLVLVSYDIAGCLGIAAFDAATGKERWTAQAPKPGMNARSARISVASLAGKATVLGSCGSGTLALDATTGERLWWFDLIEANPQTMKNIPERFLVSEKAQRDYKVDALRTPFPGFCPLVWCDYVLDAACVGHNAVTSATWCLKIEGGQATRVWQTNDFVPTSASLKSSMAVHEGKLYGFDSYFPGFTREYAVTRPYRGEKVGEFQCRDVATGKLLWSSDAFNPAAPSAQRPDSTNGAVIVTPSALIVTNNHGLWIAQLRADGVTVLAHVPQAVGKLARLLSEPALADGRLFLRQLDADPKAGLAPALGRGNLFCLDVKKR